MAAPRSRGLDEPWAEASRGRAGGSRRGTQTNKVRHATTVLDLTAPPQPGGDAFYCLGMATSGADAPARRYDVRHREVTAASPAEVWAWYANPDRWRRWDGGVASVELDGPFATGTRGHLRLPNGRRGRLRLLDVRAGAAFTDRVRLPLLTITTQHELVPQGSGCEIVHTVRLGGTLARFFPRLMALPVRRSLPTSVAQLAFLAARETVS